MRKKTVKICTIIHPNGYAISKYSHTFMWGTLHLWLSNIGNEWGRLTKTSRKFFCLRVKLDFFSVWRFFNYFDDFKFTFLQKVSYEILNLSLLVNSSNFVTKSLNQVKTI
jgi:hypothetical protein